MKLKASLRHDPEYRIYMILIKREDGKSFYPTRRGAFHYNSHNQAQVLAHATSSVGMFNVDPFDWLHINETSLQEYFDPAPPPKRKSNEYRKTIQK